MPGIARGQENTESIINWFITVGGVLTDAWEVGYRIYDITGGLPGTQVFPTTPGDYETVTSAPGNFATGSYYAYDNANTRGWTPELTEAIGTHRIEWRWKISAGAPYQAGLEDFEVLVQSGGSSVDTYIAIQDVRDAGLLEADWDDATVLAAIEMWQAFLDRACRQWFVPKAMILQVDGTDSDALHFGVPIISIDYVKLNNDTAELNTDYYRVYTGRGYPDDRRNPRIKLVSGGDFDIYTQPMSSGRMKFRKGRQNQEIKGVFGFTEEDGSVPKMIKRALLKLVVEKLTRPVYGDIVGTPAPPLVGAVIDEWTDGHKLKTQAAGGEIKPRAPGLIGITGDQEILDIIKLYKAPIGIATPANDSYGGGSWW